MKKITFLGLNIIFIILEYYCVFLCCNFIFKLSFRISLIITLSLLAIGVIITLLAFVVLLESNKEVNSDEKRNHLIDEMILKINKENKLSLKLIYLTSIQPNPAWCIKKTVFINNSYPVDDIFLEGMVAHEIGHAQSGISGLVIIASARLSTIISKLLFLLISFLSEKISDLFIYPIYGLYIIFNIFNFICVYPFVINDEYYANDYAISIGYGEQLRCYYSFGLDIKDKPKWLRLTDFSHPNIRKMIDRMNKKMNISGNLSNFYYVNNILIACDASTKTITIPEFIEVINAYAFRKASNTVKIRGLGIKEVKYNAFKNVKNLEELILPNVVIFDYGAINSNKLCILKINNMDLLNGLINYYKEHNICRKLTSKF